MNSTKAAEAKTAAAPVKRSAPFFQREGGQGFFGAQDAGPSFFSGREASVIQPKLSIGAPNDKYEQEADALADKVVQQLSQTTVPAEHPKENSVQAKPLPPPLPVTPVSRTVQTKCAACEHEEELQ